MRRYAAALCAALALAIAAPAPASPRSMRSDQPTPVGVEGVRSGSLDTGSGMKLRLAFNVARGADGALIGELDLQVPAGEHLLGIAAAHETGGNRGNAIVKLAGLSHLFQKAKLGAPSEYGDIEETFSPAALDVIGEWIARQTRRTP